jgi:hypothetical protein
MSTDADSHKLLSTYESLLRDIATILASRPPLLKYLFLNTGFYSYIVKLTDDEKETRFFPTLTARERAIIKAHLTDYGEDDHEGILSDEDENAIRPMWPSSITISKHGDGDFFRTNSTHEFDRFGYVTNSETKSVTEIGFVDNGEQGKLLELLRPGSTTNSHRINATHSPTTPPSATSTIWKIPNLRIPATESSMTMASPQSEAHDHTDHGRLKTISLKSSSDAQPPSQPSWRNGSVSNKVKRIRFSDNNCDLTIIRASASMSPERLSPGNVAHVSFLSAIVYGHALVDIFIKRFETKPDGSIDLYLTKQGKFNEILNAKQQIKALRITVTQGGTTESKEITQDSNTLWFETSMD